MRYRNNPTFGMLSGALIGAIVGIVIFFVALEPEQSATLGMAFRQAGIVTALVGGWLGRIIIGWSVPKVSRPAVTVGNGVVLLLTLAGMWLGVMQASGTEAVEETAVSSFPFIFWPLCLGVCGFWLGRRVVGVGQVVTGSIPTGVAGLATFLMALLGVSLNSLNDTYQATLDLLLQPGNLLVAIFFGWLGLLIAGRIARIGFDVLRVLLGYAFVGALIGVLALVYLPVDLSSLQELFVSGSIVGVAGSLVMIKRTTGALVRALLGAGGGLLLVSMTDTISPLTGLSLGVIVSAMLSIWLDLESVRRLA